MANNIITAAFSSSTITYTKPAYQYDYGMILKFSGIELPQAYEVHFSNTEFCGESISQIGDADGVTIPDEMFLSGAPIYAWTFLHTGEDDGETVYKTVISINKRAQPSDIEPTPVQQDVITQAIAALNTAVEQTAADVVAAGESAEAAAGSAETAGQAKDDAVEAKDKAVEAKNAAETAQGKAEDAQRAAEQAAGSVLGLTADASVDANVGTPSVEVEVTTESDHKNMSFAFHNLKGVQGDIGVGISSVVLNADYTLTITLTNGTSYTTTSIRGEVGATPNLTIGTVSTLPEGSQATATITGTEENPVLNLGIPVGDTGDPGISPTITVTEITGGHEVAVTDAEGTQTFNVMDGLDGQSGLITDYVAEEKTPYLFRPSANSLANVISEKDELIGGTVAWNQLVPYESISSPFITGGITYTKTSNGEWSFSGTSTSTSNSISDINMLANHVYLIREKSVANKWAIRYGTFYRITSDRDGLRIVKQTSYSTTSVGLQIYSNGLSVSGTIKPQLFDLTQMFGATIADHIYALETANAGAGVAWSRKYFPKDYYAYNAGQLLSVKTSEHKMTGFNQWDEEWEVGGFNYTTGENSSATDRIRSKNYCKCLPYTQYYWLIPNQNLRILFYDADKNYINFDGWYDTARTITTPSNAYYFKLAGSTAYGTTYKNDICINLSGSKNGTYEPYSVHSYPLDSDLVLRGVLELDASNNLYYDGDVYKCDGSVQRKYGAVDLGTLTWTVEDASTGRFYSNVNAIKLNGMILNAQGWTCQRGTISVSSWGDKSVGATNSQVYLLLRIKDSAYANMTASQFKTAMSGKYIVYELATPTTESADPFAQYQIVSADGTEEYVDERTVPIPVGHDTFYQQAVDVPQLPTTDGAYRLALSLTGNTATASWEYVAQAEMKAQTNIPSGKYFSVGERLFISTQAIAQGAAIVVGTNCLETTLADALNTINS